MPTTPRAATRSRRVGDPRVEHLVGDVVELADEPEAVVLAQHAALPRRLAHAVPARSRGVQPARVQVGRHEDDGHVARDVVEDGPGRGIRPEPVAVAEADHLGFAAVDGCRDDRRGRGRRVRPGEVDAAGHHRPLREVHVPVVQAGHEESAVEVDPAHPGRSGGAGRLDRRDASAREVHVDGLGGPGEPHAREHERLRGIRGVGGAAVGDAAHARAARSASWVRRISAASAGLA